MNKKRLITILTILVMAITIIPVTTTSVDAETASTYKYKRVYGDEKWVTKTAKAGGQDSDGTRFRTGGGFYYSEAKTRQVTTTVSFGSKFGKLNIAFPIGRSSSGEVGTYVSVPSTKYHYHLMVEKSKKVKPYIIYRKLRYDSDAEWEKYYTGYVVLATKRDLYAKRVK